MRLRARDEICPTSSWIALIGFGVVDDDRIHLIGEKIADGPLDQIGFLEQAHRRRQFLKSPLNVIPLLQQDT